MKDRIIKNKRNCVLAAICGIILSLIFVWGYQLEFAGRVEFGATVTWLCVFGLAIVFATGLIFLFSIGNKKKAGVNLDKSVADDISVKKSIFIYGLFFFTLLLFWTVYVMGVYPGYFCYDSTWQWYMYQNGEITNHHPVLHTLIMGWLVSFGTDVLGALIKGAFIYMMVQVVFTAACLAYMLLWMYKRKTSKLVLVISVGILTLFPPVVINILSVTKDSWFAPAIILLSVLTIDMIDCPASFFGKWHKKVLWIISLLFSTIMRNNSIYPLAFLLVALVVVNRKYIKKYLVILGIFCVIFVLYSGPFSSMITTGEKDNEEFYSVPIQQMMWVYNNESIDSWEKEQIEELFGKNIDFAKDYYNSKIADGPKAAFDYDLFASDRGKYIRLYLDLAKKYPGDFANAFLANTYCLWYPEGTQVVSYLGYEAYLITRSVPPFINVSKIPFIEKYLSHFENDDFVIHNQATKWIFAIGTWFCVFLVVFFLCIAKRKKGVAIVMATLLLYWMTFLLGPCALTRYVSYLFYMIPLLVYFVIDAYKYME